jgi:hypothetical protein
VVGAAPPRPGLFTGAPPGDELLADGAPAAPLGLPKSGGRLNGSFVAAGLDGSGKAQLESRGEFPPGAPKLPCDAVPAPAAGSDSGLWIVPRPSGGDSGNCGPDGGDSPRGALSGP